MAKQSRIQRPGVGRRDPHTLVGDPVTTQQMEDFVKACSDVVHLYSSHQVTVGSARRKWVHYWQDMTKTHLVRFFSTSPVFTAQDGGEIIKDLADSCSDIEWEAMTREFFSSETTTKHAKEILQ